MADNPETPDRYYQLFKPYSGFQLTTPIPRSESSSKSLMILAILCYGLPEILVIPGNTGFSIQSIVLRRAMKSEGS